MLKLQQQLWPILVLYELGLAAKGALELITSVPKEPRLKRGVPSSQGPLCIGILARGLILPNSMPFSTESTLTREEAADLLRVSVRTIDRYIRRRHFDVKRSGREVWISRSSFERFHEGQQVALVSETAATAAIATTAQADTAKAGAYQSSEQDISGVSSDVFKTSDAFTRHEHAYPLTPAYIYKTLYEELKEKHDDQVKRLEGAHYRVGQLEAQLESTVPLVEFKKQRKQLLLMNDQYRATFKEAQQKLFRAKKCIEGERFNKNVYISLVYALLALHVVFWGLLR